jgi:transposase
VVTPGKNVKRYLAGALDATTDRLVWVSGRRKDSLLFIALLAKLLKVYAERRVIHVICDNYQPHSSRTTRLWLAAQGKRLRLHFLPPYCPDDNRIERRVWREVHANVTRNHECATIEQLMGEVVYHLMSRNRAAKRRWLRCA